MFVLALTLSNCQVDEDSVKNNLQTINLDYKSKIIEISSVPEINSIIQGIGNPIQITNKGTDKDKLKIIFDKTNAIEVIDKDQNKKYSFRFAFDNTPENIFYNLIIAFSPTGEKSSYVLKYTCNDTHFLEYKNHNYNFYYFKGEMAVHKTTDYFKTSNLFSKSKTDCPQQYDQYGDPLPIVSVNIAGGGSGGSSSTGGSTGSTGTSSGGGGGGGCSITSYTSSCWCKNDLVGSHNHTEPVSYIDIKCSPRIAKNSNSLTDCPDNTIPTGLVGGIYSVPPTKAEILKTDLALTKLQWMWLYNSTNAGVANILFDYLYQNDKSSGAIAYSKNMILELMSITSTDYPGMNDGLNYQWWLDDSQIESIMADPYETWKKVSKKEKELIKDFPNHAYQIYKNKTVAFQKTNQIFGNVPGNLNGKADAFRHAFFQAINTVKIGKYSTSLFADAHESETPNNLIKEKQMDLSNNEKGMNLIAFDHPNWTDINLIVNEVNNLIINGQLTYLSPINYNSTSFWDNPNTTILNDGDHGISQNTQLIPTNQ